MSAVLPAVFVAVVWFALGWACSQLWMQRRYRRIVDGYVEQNLHCCQAVRAAVTRERQIRQAANQRLNAESKARMS